jgi:hypothetical protein
MERALGWVIIGIVAAGAVVGCAHREPEPAESRHIEADHGTPPPHNSKLAKVEVGMSVRDVEQVLGPPNDENAYVTGKAFIPWYFGPDRMRHAYFYRGLGRVVFEGSGGFSTSWHVQRVEYDPNETGRAH